MNLCSCDAARLEDELVQLRESTKLALNSSWDEVESLQKKNSSLQETVSDLEARITKQNDQLSKARDREKDLVRRHDKLVSKLLLATSSSRNAPFYRKVFSSRHESAPLIAPSIAKTMHDFRRNSMGGSFKTTGFSRSTPQLVIDDDEDEDTREAVLMSLRGSKQVPLNDLEDVKGSKNKKVLRQLSTSGRIHSTPLKKETSNESFGGTANTLSSISRPTLSRKPPPLCLRSEVALSPAIEMGTDPLSGLLPSLDATNSLVDIIYSDSTEECDADEKDLQIQELKIKLQSRDDSIISMEETMTLHIKHMQELHFTHGVPLG